MAKTKKRARQLLCVLVAVLLFGSAQALAYGADTVQEVTVLEAPVATSDVLDRDKADETLVINNEEKVRYVDSDTEEEEAPPEAGAVSLQSAAEMNLLDAGSETTTVNSYDEFVGALADNTFSTIVIGQPFHLEGTIAISRNVSIEGGNHVLTSDGARHFSIATGSTVTIGNIVLEGEGGIGGIFCASAVNLSLENVTVQNCVTTSRNVYIGYGSALRMEKNGVLSVSNCTFSGNEAVKGSAIYTEFVKATIQNSSFTGNKAFYSKDEDGGIIYAENSETAIFGSSFADNEGCSVFGTVMVYIYQNPYRTEWNENSSLSVTNCDFIHNKGVLSAGVQVDGHALEVQSSAFERNTVTGGSRYSEGVAIMLSSFQSSSFGVFEASGVITDCTFTKNGRWLDQLIEYDRFSIILVLGQEGLPFTFKNSTMEDNSTRASILFARDTKAELDNVNLLNNVASSYWYTPLWFESSTANLTNCTLKNNVLGSGCVGFEDTFATMRACTIDTNYGGIVVSADSPQDGMLEILASGPEETTNITNNSGDYHDSINGLDSCTYYGGIYVTNLDCLKTQYVTFSGNTIGKLDATVAELGHWSYALYDKNIQNTLSLSGGVNAYNNLDIYLGTQHSTVTYTDPVSGVSFALPFTLSSGRYDHNLLYGAETGLSREGYVITGWNTQADGKGTTYLPRAAIDAENDVTVYAVWALAPTSTPDPSSTPDTSTPPTGSGTGGTSSDGGAGGTGGTMNASSDAGNAASRAGVATGDSTLPIALYIWLIAIATVGGLSLLVYRRRVKG